VGARSSADVFAALRGLPNAVLESMLAPRLLAAGATIAAVPSFRRAKRIALAAAVSAAWLLATTILAVAYAVSLLVIGTSAIVAGVFAVSWLLVSWGSWRTWRRGSRR
jgi:hypothetical protein